MLFAVAAMTALACALASARRIWLVTHATFLHPDDLVAWLGAEVQPDSVDRLREALSDLAHAEWELEFLDALFVAEPARSALLNAQLGELERRLKAFEHVPRVCARIATSTGFLFGTLALRRVVADAGEWSLDASDTVVHEAILRAMILVAMGLASTAFCVAAHRCARKLAHGRLEAVDRMVDRLEAILERREV